MSSQQIGKSPYCAVCIQPGGGAGGNTYRYTEEREDHNQALREKREAARNLYLTHMAQVFTLTGPLTCYHTVSQFLHSHDRPLQYFPPHLTHMALVYTLTDPHAGMWQLPSLVPSPTQLLTAMLPITLFPLLIAQMKADPVTSLQVLAYLTQCKTQCGVQTNFNMHIGYKLIPTN